MTTDLRELLQAYLSLLESDYVGPAEKDLTGGKIAKVRAALAEPAPEPVALSRLRQMFEDYRDAWSPGARDELLATFYAQLSTAPPPASPSDARDAARYRKLRYVGAYLSDRLLFRDALDDVVDGFIDASIEQDNHDLPAGCAERAGCLGAAGVSTLVLQ